MTDARRFESEFYRLFKRADDGFLQPWGLWADIWGVVVLLESGDPPIIRIGSGPAGPEISHYDTATEDFVPAPPVTTDINSALLLWPEDARPTTWSGTPTDCCLAALKERRSRWRLEQRKRAAAKKARDALVSAG